jgi:hypothetical protein
VVHTVFSSAYRDSIHTDDKNIERLAHVKDRSTLHEMNAQSCGADIINGSSPLSKYDPSPPYVTNVAYSEHKYSMCLFYTSFPCDFKQEM